MLTPNYTILYVADPHASARLYGKLLDTDHVETSPMFVLFPLENGRMLGLWAKSDTVPAADFHGSSSELVFRVADDAQVDALHGKWREAGLRILPPPTKVDFGYTFTAADPDGHRLRVFARGE